MSQYQQYLKSDHWRELRDRKLAQSPWCELCGTVFNRHVHHLRYKQLWDCDLDDLMTLCGEDHTDFHLAQENLGWNVSTPEEAISMIRYFRSLPEYEALKRSKPTGNIQARRKPPYAQFKSKANFIMASYRRKTPLTPNDVREMIFKLQTLLASEHQ